MKGYWKIMSEEITKIYERKGLKPPKCHVGRKHHTAAFHRIVAGIKAKRDGVRSSHAVATAQLQKQGKRIYK